MKATALATVKNTIPAVNKAMELVRLLADRRGETTTKALAIRLGLPRTTCYRILQSLVAADWVRRTDEGRHELSVGLMSVLRPLRSLRTLETIAEPILESLAARACLTAKVSVRQGDDAVTVARVQSPGETAIAVRVGAAFHLCFGSSGAVLLAGLAQEEVAAIIDRAPSDCWLHQRRDDVFRRIESIRKNGWCADLGTYRPSCHAISAPLVDAAGNVAASLTLIGFPHELSNDRIPSLAKMLLDAARRANRELKKG